ncbi:MAG: DUF2344 domain-containing protein [Planctomycetes bacterium]|nr:DUF2344 domain-containing protein [Planctomycetota bacterium]
MQIDTETQGAKTSGARRWMVWFSIEGDLRFLSHRNVMNLCERASARAGLPVAFSKGFNPRPKISLLLPRPVGVASQCELLIIRFEQAFQDTRWLERFSKQFPPGAKILRAEPLPDKGHIWVKSVTYQLFLTDIESKAVSRHLAEIRSNKDATTPIKNEQTNDNKKIEKYILNMDIVKNTLTFTIAGNPRTTPPGPDRVLRAIGFADPSEVISRLTKTKLLYEITK